MKSLVSILLLFVVAWGIITVLPGVPFGESKTQVGDYYIREGRTETGAANIVTSVVVNYRGFDTLGEVTVLFTAAIGLGAVLAFTRKKGRKGVEPGSLVLLTGCRFLFPLILLFGAYIFIHGHLTPGGGFQGGAIIASAYVLAHMGCRGRDYDHKLSSAVESLGGLLFIVVAMLGLVIGSGYFLANFMPKGTVNTLFSSGIIPIIYIAIGFKVGAELAGIIDHLIKDSE